ncbi:MAG: hypothetical protein ABSC89_04060 [Verrucomicrobiota bacterium]|jgi:hypothetical protein
MKHDTYEKYSKARIDLPQKALLTTWDCLPDFRNDLVLVGGLAVRYLTKQPAEGLPGAVTLDVDLGISIAASSGSYPGIRDNLSGHGFKWENGRFVRMFDDWPLYIDLLTDDSNADKGTVVVDDGLPVGIFPGIDRALACNRLIEVSGKTLLDIPLAEKVKIAEVGPLLVLKLNAFGGPGGRKAPKDAHDILYLAMNYLDGPQRAIESFQEERRVANRGVANALKCLEAHFASPDAQGSISCAAFRLNNLHREPQFEQESLRIRQQCVTLAQSLLS